MVLLSIEFLIFLVSIILIIIGKVKNKRAIFTTGICIILLQILVTIVLFTYLIEREQEITVKNTETVIEQEELPIPDRIIVKDEEGKYEIIQSWDGSGFSDIYSLLYSEMVNTIEGKVYQEDEISKMQEQGSFIELDYNTKSKNFVFMLDEEEIGAIRRFDDSGQVIKTSLKNKETLKAAVKHISYFPYYEKLSEIISKSKLKITGIESRKLKEVNKHNSSVKGLLSTIDNLNYKISREEENKKQFETHIETIKIALADGETKISGLASYSMLVKKYKDCENEINKLLSETTRIDEFQREKLPSLWVLRGIEPMIQQCKEIIEKHKEEEYTVPEKKYLDNPSRSKLEEILKDKKCFVCGTEFSEDDAPYHYITERLRLQEEYLKEMEEYTSNMQLSKQFNMFVGKIQDYPDSLLISLSKIDKQWKDSEDELERYMAQRRRKQDEKRKLDEQIEDIKKKHGVDPVTQAETAGIINSSIRASRSNLETLQRKLDVSKQTLSNYRSELRIAERELEKLGAKDTTVAKVPETEWKHISTFLEDICKRVQENARKDLLHKIEERANLFYAKFTEHDNGYKGNVKIGEDYSIEFDAGLNTSHEDRKKMSIINALLSLNQEAMGTYYPFISDAPTSSLDLETTHKYLLGIKDIFSQSIVLTKDVDLESDKYLDLQNQSNVSRIYNLESKIYSGDANRGQHEVSTQITILK